MESSHTPSVTNDNIANAPKPSAQVIAQVDKLIPYYRRPAGKRGPWSNTEKAMRDANKAAREELTAELMELEALKSAHRRVVGDNRLLRNHVEQLEDQTDHADRHTATVVQNGGRAIHVLVQLAAMMFDGGEFTILHTSTTSRPKCSIERCMGATPYEWRNGYGLFQLHGDRLTITPKRTEYVPITILIDSDGITPEDEMSIRSYLGLTPQDNPLSSRARDTMRRREVRDQEHMRKLIKQYGEAGGLVDVIEALVQYNYLERGTRYPL